MDTAIYFSLSFVYFLLLIVGIYAAIKERWMMGVVGLLSIPFDSKAIENISELVLILSLFTTQSFQSRNENGL
ncbi:MAG: hypothetical protein LRY71_09660 [Bacillaceae bacterium]|nr:hypothetical protein [Bacillaceae bacterium]